METHQNNQCDKLKVLGSQMFQALPKLTCFSLVYPLSVVYTFSYKKFGSARSKLKFDDNILLPKKKINFSSMGRSLLSCIYKRTGLYP